MERIMNGRERGREPARFVGIDLHKRYFVATGVDVDQTVVLGPERVGNERLESWAGRALTGADAVVLEMTTNTWTMVDRLEPLVHSVTVVHPPHVHLITRARVMTDKKAALTLAQLHCAGLLPGIWIPPKAVRELRALVAQRWRMVELTSQAKCRLRSLLHRYNFDPPPRSDPFTPAMRDWWEGLPLPPLAALRLAADLDTLAFAQRQRERIEGTLAQWAAADERLPLLVQLPGIGFVNAVTILAAVGEIERFPTPSQLVGYAGLGAQVHDSGESQWRGRITKQGRRDLRRALVEAAQTASRYHPHWRGEYERLGKRIGRNKARVAVARKLLVAVWHVLSKETADRWAVPQQVACSLFKLAYQLGIPNLPRGMSALQFTRCHLDRLGLGDKVTEIRWGSKIYRLPPPLPA